MSAAFDEYSDLGLPFTPPTPVQKRVDMRREESERRVLMALGEILEAVNGGAAGGGYTATASFASVTESVLVAFPATTPGSIVTIVNNGASPVLVLAGGTPRWNGQDGATADEGFPLQTGGSWTTQVRIRTAVNVRCQVGQTSRITIEKLT